MIFDLFDRFPGGDDDRCGFAGEALLACGTERFSWRWNYLNQSIPFEATDVETNSNLTSNARWKVVV